MSVSNRAKKKRLLLIVFKKLLACYGPQHWWPADTSFEVMVGAILTQNTAWTNVEKAIQNLKRGKLLSVKRLSKAPISVIARAIRPAGYFNVKAKRLKNFLIFLDGEYRGSLKRLLKEPVQKLRERLLAVNGVGPETADSIILYAAKKPVFVVDAYTRRIFSRLGFVAGHESYDVIQDLFTTTLPSHTGLFNEFHALIVAHAKAVCLKKPECGECTLRRSCDYGRAILQNI